MKGLKFFLFIGCCFIISSCRDGIIEFDSEIKTGDLYISSNPNGAEIFFDYIKTGKTTPDSLLKIQPGNYSVTVRLMGYGEETVNVDVVAGQKKHIIVRIN